MMRLLYDWILPLTLFVRSKSSPYFQFDDMFYAECIPTVHLKDYLYYGNLSTYIRGSLLPKTPLSVTKSTSSLSGQCEVWKNVVSAMTQWAVNNSVTDYWIYPDEFMNHKNCRNFDLTLRNDDDNHHLAIHMKIIESNASAIGPWCYAYDTINSKYYVARCFPECVGNNYQNSTLPQRRIKIPIAMDMKPNYNTKLIDAIAINAFSRYEWGPFAYYDSRPSSVLLSAEFEKHRYSAFVPMIVFGMALMSCSILFVIVQNYIKTRHKKKGVEGEIPSKKQSTATKLPAAIAPTASNPIEHLKQEKGTPV